MASKISDIAAEVNVSNATVSLVLNRKPGVSMETRRKVLDAARRMHYKFLPEELSPIVKEKAIRFLRIARHGQIVHLDQNSIISEYIEGLEQEAKVNGWRLEISFLEQFDSVEVLNIVNDVSIAGVVILGTELSEECINVIRDSPTPAVFIDTDSNNPKCDLVNVNNGSAVFSVVDYLYGLGHREIGIVTDPMESENIRARERAYFQALKSLGLSGGQDYFYSVNSIFAEKEGMSLADLFQTAVKLPTALFCVADIIAYETMKALKTVGVSVPNDISLVGFDDLSASCYVDPPLTSIRVSKRRIGQKAIQLLLQRINEPDAPNEKILISGELVIRDSARVL